MKELSKICKLPFEEITKSFKLIWFGLSGLYISNFKKIIDYRDKKGRINNRKEIEKALENLDKESLNVEDIIRKGLSNLAR